MKASICMSAYQRPTLLRRTLESIYRQSVPFDFETIVVDDGGDLPQSLRDEFPQVQWHALPRHANYRNPGLARNVAYRAAQGEVLICQSEEVIHASEHCIERLVATLQPGCFVIARIEDLDEQGHVVVKSPTASNRREHRPFFFLGSIFRHDMYAVGGNDVDFQRPGYEDRWLAQCLTNGLGLSPIYCDHIVGQHQYHTPVAEFTDIYANRRIYGRKKRHALATGRWTASTGPWPTKVPRNQLNNPFRHPRIALGSHLALLLQAIQMSSGPIVELGTGLYSTPFLHWACVPRKRPLFSYESAPQFMPFAKAYENEHHHVELIEDWDALDLSAPWSVALVDHAPADHRVAEIRRLRHAQFVVVHDTTVPSRRHQRIYGYGRIHRLFRHRFERIDNGHGTTVFSDTHDVENIFQ